MWAADYRERHAEQIAAYSAATKPAQALRNKRRYEEHKDAMLAAQKEYYEKNKPAIRKQRAEYRKANRDAIRVQQMKRQRERRRTDKTFALITALRHRMTNALAGKASKAARTIELLGCTGAEAMAHIERQFKPGMSWDNRREWHVDHIKPLAKFDMTDPAQQRQAFHYTNLQPLWASENMAKGAK